MPEVYVECDAEGHYFVRDGRGLQKATPVVIIGQVDPDEREASEHGAGINLTQPVVEDNSNDIMEALQFGLDGFYGDMQLDKTPGPITFHAEALVTDGAGNVAAPIVGAPGLGFSHRILDVTVRCIALVGSLVIITDGVTEACHLPCDISNGRDRAPVNMKCADNAAINGVISGGGAVVTYIVGVSFRTEVT